MADVHQAHETLVIIISQALGGGSSSSSSAPGPIAAPESAYARNAEDLEARLRRALG